MDDYYKRIALSYVRLIKAAAFILSASAMALLLSCSVRQSPGGQSQSQQGASGPPQNCFGGLAARRDCSRGQCAAAGLEKTVFNEWKTQFLRAYGMPKATFASNIKILDVGMNADQPGQLWWNVQYLFVKDWVASREVSNVNLGPHSPRNPPDAATIERAVRLALMPPVQKFNLSSVISRARARQALESCAPALQIDWCGVQFETGSGIPVLRGKKKLNGSRDECQLGIVNLINGSLVDCYIAICAAMNFP